MNFTVTKEKPAEIRIIRKVIVPDERQTALTSALGNAAFQYGGMGFRFGEGGGNHHFA